MNILGICKRDGRDRSYIFHRHPKFGHHSFTRKPEENKQTTMTSGEYHRKTSVLVTSSVIILIVLAGVTEADECSLTPVIHVLQYPGCVPKPIPSFACMGKCTSYVQVWQLFSISFIITFVMDRLRGASVYLTRYGALIAGTEMSFTRIVHSLNDGSKVIRAQQQCQTF